MVIYVVKPVFCPGFAGGENPPSVSVPTGSAVSSLGARDTPPMLLKQARYQLRYTRLFSFLSGWAYSPKCKNQYFYFDLHALYHILLFLVAFCSLSSVGISSVFLLVMVKIVVKNAGSLLPNTASREMLFLAAIDQETKRISDSSSVNMPSNDIPD